MILNFHLVYATKKGKKCWEQTVWTKQQKINVGRNFGDFLLNKTRNFTKPQVPPFRRNTSRSPSKRPDLQGIVLGDLDAVADLRAINVKALDLALRVHVPGMFGRNV